jgi:uncharacterized protein YehS (DUF1456 family)
MLLIVGIKYYYGIYHKERDIGYTAKDDVQLESYLLSAIKPKTDKENKTNSLTLWENIHTHNVLCKLYNTYYPNFT